LSSAYSLSNLSFVGGTLCPVGGHNILEPPMYHCPVIVGPFVMNVRAAVELLKKQEAYLEVKGEEELRDLIASLLENRSVLNELAEKSFHAACSARGVTELVYSEINKYI
jgi:3-deoxy-D-manno-octulosonic-acid transferase